MLNASAVVPTAVEQDDFPWRRQLGDITLKIPLAALALRGRAERHDAADARVQALGDALDDASLAGRVAALENDHDAQALQANPFLQLDQLELQMGEFVEILVVLGRLAWLRAVGQVPVLLECGHFLRVAQHRFLWLRRLAGLVHVHLRRTALSNDHVVFSILYLWPRPLCLRSTSTAKAKMALKSLALPQQRTTAAPLRIAPAAARRLPTSSASFCTPPLTLLLDVRDCVPSWHALRKTEFASIRLHLLKIAGRIVETASRIRVALASCCPEAGLFSLLAFQLQKSGP